MNSRLLFLSVCLLLASFRFLNEHVGADDLPADQVAWFETNIRPLLADKCYSCHSIREGESDGGLTLDTRQGWQKGGDHGPAIVPKDLDASTLIRAVRYSDPDLQMPPDKKLTPRQIKLVEQWVKMGAPDPRTNAVSERPSQDPSDPVAGRAHWAFQPLKKVAMPKLPGDLREWAKEPIDFFVADSLDKEGLSPNDEADRRALARRVYFLLIGLPPTQQELEEFENDPSPDAYERLVDRLIGSPQFGEVWGRHWLDLARYADSNGLDENFLFREAWRYRNWVINAINRDQTFDAFTREQIAGDLLPFKSIAERDRQRIGSGFLVIGPKVLLGVNGELQKMDVADELIDTVGTTFLGQTLGCARCHDHKFDPIPTEDYYALAGIFTSTEVMQTRYMLGQQRKMERLFGLGEPGNQVNEAYEEYWRERGKLKSRLDQSKKTLEVLKKKESDLKELIKNQGNSLAPTLKELLEKRIGLGFPSFVSDQTKNDPAEKASDPSNDQAITHEKAVELQQQHVQKLEKQYGQPPAIPPRAMIPTDKPKVADEAVRVAGQFNKKGKAVPRGFLTVLSADSVQLPKNTSGRLELANWLTDCQSGAGNLSARVLANRIWHHLIGRGIVRTTDNLGRTGEQPSHPELLDFLAGELIENRWSIKHLVRTIVLSQTFRQSSRHQAKAAEKDPENRYLWRAHRRRLSPEAFRDAMLKVSGQLDQRRMGSSVGYLGDQATAVGANTNRRRTDFPNRSVYLPVIRNDLPEIFEAFDFTDTHRTTGARPETTVATTGLYILNDPQVMVTSRQLASRILQLPGISDQQRATRLLETVLGKKADLNEVHLVLNSIVEFEKLALRELENQNVPKHGTPNTTQPPMPNQTGKSDTMPSNPGGKGTESNKNVDVESKVAEQKQKIRAESRLRAWATACHALFASSEFQILP